MTVVPLMRDISDAAIIASEQFQALWDQMGAQPSDRVCPSHGELMRGGRCMACGRKNQPRRYTGR